ncbi:UvrD-helicase domain-containing protein [Bergeyella sp. RCAD1439]|uniref:UvrD-helicase domain-containing protein n=1 Tax=Bergeyella anatis TaxID=3113737 RepID=UPI002E194341|nr:UvrD-helicase domain-containing protein [Bergeyella sp. RCAD1439]
MNESKSYIAINASAGSGKTYTLVQRVLALCLKQENHHDAIRHILALTFTNKAANEMKERILKWLKAFTKEDYFSNNDLKAIRENLHQMGIHVTMSDLNRRAQKTLDYILHNYSTLNIGTIDKFNTRLVRSFSYELGLPHKFGLEIQSKPYLIEAVDQMLDHIGEDPHLSEAFMDFVNYNLDNEARISLNSTLYRKAQTFINDTHYHQLKANESFDWQAYENAKNQLREEIAAHKEQMKTLAMEGTALIKNNHLEAEDFASASGGSLGKWFPSVLQFLTSRNAKMPLPADEETALAKINKGASSKSKNRQQDILNLLPNLLQWREEILNHYIQSEKKTKILNELLPLKINTEIQETLNTIEEENDLVLLSKFNILIHENLKTEPSNFIYEKIGTQYHHFFFDEFQDTSTLQWQNIIPLKDHTVTSLDHSFTLVGDPKQSIYRFRGGDSELMLNILEGQEPSPVPVTVEVLENNWRSAKNIVDFNNELYAFTAQQGLSEAHRKLFSDHAKQNAVKTFPGRVKVQLSPNCRRSEDYYANIAEQMHRSLQECLDNGFSFSDITLLCRTGAEIQKLSRLLSSQKVFYKGKETYLKTISEKGLSLDLSPTLRAVIEYLRWEQNPENKQYLIKMLYYLKETGRISVGDFSEEILSLLQLPSDHQRLKEIERRYNLNLRHPKGERLNLYNHIENCVMAFSVEGKETDFLLNFLENLYGLTQNTGVTVKDFIKYWDEEAHSLAIQASENVDAINLMTIHAAKGLEFPVVFLPFRHSHKDGEFNEWLEVEGLNQLKSVNIEGFKKELERYDEEILSFNEENAYKNKIDRLCLQYVATTRAVEQLFLYLERPPKAGSKLEIYDYIESLNPEDLDEFDLYPAESFAKHHTEKTSRQETLEIPSIAFPNRKKSQILIATPSKNYQNKKEAVRIGILAHSVLEKIRTTEDLPKVLNQYLMEGLISSEDLAQIQSRLTNVMNDKEWAPLFAPGLKIINEKEIMVTENGQTEIYRPDRLIETPEGLILLDFKTGAEQQKHEKQIERYKAVIEKTGRTVCQTRIIYL